MTDRNTSSRNRSAIDLDAVIPWSNAAGETIPAYAVVQLRTNHSTRSIASKPNSSEGLFFVNGLISILSAANGESLTWDKPRPVLLDGSPTVGTEVGPVSGQWYMSEEGSGFRVLLQPTAGVGVVVPVGGGSGGGHHVWFTIESVVCNEDDTKTLYVTPTWYTGGCDKPIPGADEYGQLTVEDPCSILGYYTADWLGSGGIKGRATYMYPREGTCTPKWLVDQICGQPECS